MKYLTYFMNENQKLLVYGTLKDALQMISKSNFIRVHRSYIINLNFIDFVEGKSNFNWKINSFLSVNLTEKNSLRNGQKNRCFVKTKHLFLIIELVIVYLLEFQL